MINLAVAVGQALCALQTVMVLLSQPCALGNDYPVYRRGGKGAVRAGDLPDVIPGVKKSQGEYWFMQQCLHFVLSKPQVLGCSGFNLSLVAVNVL